LRKGGNSYVSGGGERGARKRKQLFPAMKRYESKGKRQYLLDWEQATNYGAKKELRVKV